MVACWCAAVDVTVDGRASLTARATDCVCPACLAEASVVVVDAAETSDVDA